MKSNVLTFAVSEGKEQGIANLDRAFASNEDGLIAVFDGMSGNKHSDIASTAAFDILQATEYRAKLNAPIEEVRRRVQIVLEIIGYQIGLEVAKKKFEYSTEELDGVATTAVIAKYIAQTEDAASGVFIVGHIGDSRLYRLRDDQLRYATCDHTDLSTKLIQHSKNFSEFLARQRLFDNAETLEAMGDCLRCFGIKNKEERDEIIASRHIIGRILSPCISNDFVCADVGETKTQVGDEYYATTDGVHGNMTFDELRDIVRQPISLEQKGRQLIKRAKCNSQKKGTRFGPDDMSFAGLRVAKS